MPQYILYPIRAEPILTSWKERTTPDKWHPLPTLPAWDVKRAQYDGAFFSPVDLKQMTLPERTTPDKYEQPLEKPMWDVKRTQYAYPNLMADDDKQLTVPERTTPDKYQQPFEKPMWDVKRQQYLYPPFTVDGRQLTQPERATPDKWLGSRPDVLFRQAPYRPFAAYEMPPEEIAATVDDLPWKARDPDFAPGLTSRKPHLHPYSDIDAKQLTLGERISPDKWHPEIQRPRWDRTRNQWLYPPFTVDAYQMTLTERTTLDKWAGQKPDLLFRQAPYRPFAHYELPPEEISATVDDLPWKFKDPDPPLPAARMRDYTHFSYDASAFILGERISLDKWYKETERPPADVARKQYLNPPFSYDAFAFTQPERSTSDKWWTRTQEPRFDLRRQQYLHPAAWIDPNPLANSEVVTVDKWFRPTETRLRDAVRAQFAFPSFTVDPYQLTLGERSTPDKWLGSRPDLLFRQAPYRFFHGFEMPEELLLEATDDLPWEYRDSTVVRRALTLPPTLTVLPDRQPVPNGEGWRHVSPLLVRRELFRPPASGETPLDEVVAPVEDIPWEFRSAFQPRLTARVPRAEPAFSYTQLLDLSFLFRDSPIFSKEKPQIRSFTLEPSLDELVDQAVDLAWHYADASAALVRGKAGAREGLQGTVFPVAAAPVKIDWFFEDMVMSFLRKKAGNEAMPPLTYLFLVRYLQRLLPLSLLGVSNLLDAEILRVGDGPLETVGVENLQKADALGIGNRAASEVAMDDSPGSEILGV